MKTAANFRGRRPLLLCLIAISLLVSCVWKPELASAPASGKWGMAVSAHPLASQAGRDILKHGGNAVDAAVAAAFVLSVVEPYSSGIGGGGFMLIYPGPGKDVEVMDYRETAPSAAHREMYQKDGEVVAGLSTTGPLAAGVPGTVAGLSAALKKYGTMDLAEVMAPAIKLAEEGFEVGRIYSERTVITANKLNRDACAKEIFLDNGMPVAPGWKLVQKDLAKVLRAVAEQGPDVFYKGWIAEKIAEDMKEKGGIITEADLAGYNPRWRGPVSGSYRGYEIVSMPPPSSGGAVVIETLNILEAYDMAGMGYGSVDTVHILTEAMRRSFADRAAFMGDPAFYDVPLERLTSKDYAEVLRQNIDTEKATDSADVTPGAGVIKLPDDSLSGGPFADGDMYASFTEKHTTHLSVVDASGGAVSLTQTINTSFGSGVVACGTGILMNNEMDDFAAKPGEPNAYGLVQGEANAIAPGKIPLSSMSPTMVFRDGGLFMVIGSPGGPRIITTVIQSIMNVVDFGMDIEEAVSAPRIHHQWLPDKLLLEERRVSLPQRTRLRKMGHDPSAYIMPCNAQGVLVMPDGSLSGGSDPRGGGEAAAY